MAPNIRRILRELYSRVGSKLTDNGFYGQSWDSYVIGFHDSEYADHVYPGDEWGTPASWEDTYQRLLENSGATDWQRVVEIGSGNGKYTSMLLQRSAATILACDVSKAFLKVLTKRCRSEKESGRLRTVHLKGRAPDELLTAIEGQNWQGRVDALISIDAMVHVDLQYLSAYFVTAAVALRPGGVLAMTLADATSRNGMAKLLEDIPLYYPRQGQPSHKFEFLSPDIVSSLLTRLGFSIELLESDAGEIGTGRDMFLVARKNGQLESADLIRYLGRQSM